MHDEKNIVKSDVIVLGAGLAGLASAFGVLGRGQKPVVIEKEAIVGGMSCSIRRDGFVFDLGGHRFLPHNIKTTEYVRALFKDKTLLLRNRKSQIYLGGKFLQYPPEAIDLLRRLGIATSLKCAFGGLCARIRQGILKEPENTLKDWLMHRFGQDLYDIYFGPYSAKLWGVDPDQISSEWAPQRVSVSSIGVVIRNLMPAKGRAIKTYARKFLYPVGGIGRIPELMAGQIGGMGSKVFLNHCASKITRHENGYMVEAEDGRAGRRLFFAKKIISTMPLSEFVMMLEPRVPPEVLNAAGSLRFRSVRFLNLMLNTDEVTKNTWLYVPEDKFTFFRIQEFNKWCPKNAPRGKVGLSLEVACQKGDRLWSMPDEELLDICLMDLKKMRVDLEKKVIGYFSTYAEHAYPFYSLDYRRHLQKIYRFMESFDSIVVTGRQGLFRYLNMDRALEVGFEAAEALYDPARRLHFLRDKEDRKYLESNLHLSKKKR
ncbi:MAG TPA: hypothetical protein DCL35_02070 [Candidatus Omnitrophica bacterium]|nr:hypothetical protein [Candidatus Omnitrophota bacterium]